MPGMGVAISEPPLRSRGDGIPEKTSWKLKSHKVRRGETLAGIGRKYGISVSQLMEWNGLGSGRLKPGKRVFVSDPAEGLGDTSLVAGLPRVKAPQPQAVESGAESQTESVATVSDRPATHRVHRGETLSSLAARFEVSIAELRAWNNLSSDRVRPGMRLKLKGEPIHVDRSETAKALRSSASDQPARIVRVSGNPEENPISRTHRVRAGETLESIAHQYGVAISSIKLLNRLHGSRIRVGQKLTVPGASGRVEGKSDAPPAPKVAFGKARTVRYTVREGDSLYSIAKSRATTVDTLMELNGLRGPGIRPGQVLEVPMVASR